MIISPRQEDFEKWLEGEGRDEVRYICATGSPEREVTLAWRYVCFLNGKEGLQSTSCCARLLLGTGASCSYEEGMEKCWLEQEEGARKFLTELRDVIKQFIEDGRMFKTSKRTNQPRIRLLVEDLEKGGV